MDKYLHFINDKIKQVELFKEDVYFPLLKYTKLKKEYTSFLDVASVDLDELFFKLLLLENFKREDLENAKVSCSVENLVSLVETVSMDKFFEEFLKRKKLTMLDIFTIYGFGEDPSLYISKLREIYEVEPSGREKLDIKNVEIAMSEFLKQLESELFDEEFRSLFQDLQIGNVFKDMIFIFNERVDSQQLNKKLSLCTTAKERKLYLKAAKKFQKKSKTLQIVVKLKNYDAFIKNGNITFEREREAKIKNLERLKEKVVLLEKDYMAITQMNLSVFKDDAFSYQDLFQELFSKQKEVYEQEYDKYHALLDSSFTRQVETMLEKHGISFAILEEEAKNLIMQSESLTNLDKNLELLGVKNEDLDLEVIKVLLYTSPKIVNQISYFIHHHVVSKEKLLDNLYVFTKDVEHFKKNASLMLEHHLSLDNCLYNEDILFFPYNEIKNNEKLLKVYRNNEGAEAYIFLEDSKNFDLLDTLIENGIDLYSFDNYKLNALEIENVIKRITICNTLAIDMYTKSGNLNRSFLLGNQFYCKEDTLDDYLLISSYENKDIDQFIRNNNRNHINPSINIIEEFNKLEAYKSEDGLSYDIEGSLISRPKVMRNLTLFYELNQINQETILQSIVYNSNLNDEEILLIKNRIFKKKKMKNKK